MRSSHFCGVHPRIMATDTMEKLSAPQNRAAVADPEKCLDWVVGAQGLSGSESHPSAKGVRLHHIVGGVAL